MAFKYEQSFIKPKDIKYVDMCIYIDHTAYKENITDEEKATIYQYIYFIAFGLACKKRYFSKIEDYDGFSIAMAYKIYNRLFDARQYPPTPEEKRLKKVKSVLNYIKICLYGVKVKYCLDNFKEIIDPSINTEFDSETFKNSLKDGITSEYQNTSGFYKAIEDSISELPNIIKSVVMETPYKKDPIMFKNLYISCLITFTKSITLSRASLNKLEKKNGSTCDIKEFKDTLYNSEKDDCITLWRLDDTYYDYIKLLYNKIKKKFSEELNDTRSSFEMSDDILESILLSSNELQQSNYSGAEND